MEYQKVKSSTIAEVGYDGDIEVLSVRFKSGHEYRYYKVSKQTLLELLNAKSVGSTFKTLIRDADYKFERVK